MNAEEWLRETRELERRGELLLAYDVASRGLAEHPGDLWLRYRAVLVLARAGPARRSLTAADGDGSTPEDTYYRLATRAEAQLILGQEGAAGTSLGDARAAAGADLAALATTRKQLRLICEVGEMDGRLLDVLAPP